MKVKSTFYSLLFITICGLFFGGIAVNRGNSQLHNEVREQINNFSDAFAKADADLLNSLLTEDYMHISSKGGVLGKTEWINWIKVRREDVNSGKYVYTKYLTEDVRIKIYGQNTAAVTVVNIVEGRNNGEPFKKKIRCSHLWIKQNEIWKRALFHDTVFENN